MKIISQVKNRNISALISKDSTSFSEYVKPLSTAGLLEVKFLDLNLPLNEAIGELF